LGGLRESRKLEHRENFFEKKIQIYHQILDFMNRTPYAQVGFCP